MNRFRGHWILVLALLLALPGMAGAQIETEDGGVTSPEIPTLREFVRYLDTENNEEVRLDTQWIHGVTPSLELRATVPVYLYREVKFVGAGGARERKRLQGLGDSSLRAKYRLYQRDDVMESTRWSFLGEVTAPTGDSDRRGGGVEIPRRLQLGTGTWGFGAGTVMTVVRDRHRASADFYYRHWTRHDGFRPGQTLYLDLAYWFRLHPARFDPEEDAIEVRPVIELLSAFRFDSQGSGGSQGDEGVEVWLAPGLQIYASRSIQCEVNVKIPLVDTIDDELGDRHWGASFAIKFRF